MSLGELYTAIQSGVVDGAENNEVTWIANRHYEVAPYWSQTNHLIVPDWLLINHNVYASLSDADRAAFDELCAWATKEVAVRWDASVEDLMSSLGASKAMIKTVYDAIQEMK